MKILNYVLSIFILLLAIVSAVCSFFLFEKRELLVKGWDKMAKTVNMVATELDKGSGTNVAESLSPDIISHEQYEQLDSNLVKIVDHSKKIIQQRDELATALVNSGKAIGMSGAPAQDALTQLETYNQTADGVVKQIADTKKRYDDTVNMLVATGNRIKAPMNAGNLKGDNYKTEYAKFNNRITAIDARMKSADAGYRRFGQLVGVALNNADFEDKAFAGTANKIATGINKVKTDLAEAQKTIRQRDQQIAAIKKLVQERESEISGHKVTAQQQNDRIKAMEKLLGERGIPTDIVLWTDGSKEARRALQGRVIDVDNHYGFIVIDVGTQTQVAQKVGPELSYVNPKVPNEAEFIVARDLDKENTKYIGRIKLFRISENNAYARLMTSSAPNESIKTGDFVFMPSDVIESLAAGASSAPAASENTTTAVN